MEEKKISGLPIKAYKLKYDQVLRFIFQSEDGKTISENDMVLLNLGIRPSQLKIVKHMLDFAYRMLDSLNSDLERVFIARQRGQSLETFDRFNPNISSSCDDSESHQSPASRPKTKATQSTATAKNGQRKSKNP